MSRTLRFDCLLTDAGWLAPGWVGVGDDGTIASIAAAGPDDETAETVSGYAIAGMPNLHSHAFQRGFAGLTEHAHETGETGDDSFWTWREAMYRFVTRLTPDDVEAIAAQLYLEMLKAGYTAVAEFHYLHHAPDGSAYADRAEMARRIASAANRVGIGITHLPVLYAAGGFGGAPLGDAQRRFANDVDGLFAIVGSLRADTADDANANVGLALHSLRAVPPDMLRDAVAALEALDPEAPIHIHIAEQMREVEDCVAWSGARPVEWLLANAAIDARWCLVHATHMTDAEIAGIARSGATAGLCPTTEANLGDGVFALAAYLAHGGRFGIGSDSHVSVCPVEELRWLEYGARLTHQRRNVVSRPRGSTGAALWSGALVGGAAACGRSIGGLAAGRRADIVVLDAEAPMFAAASPEQVFDTYVFAGNRNPVRDVMVGGAWVVRDGHAAGEDAIAARYRETLARLV